MKIERSENEKPVVAQACYPSEDSSPYASYLVKQEMHSDNDHDNFNWQADSDYEPSTSVSRKKNVGRPRSSNVKAPNSCLANPSHKKRGRPRLGYLVINYFKLFLR